MSRSHSPAWDTAMSTDPCKSWLLGEGRSQSASLTFGFVLYKGRVTVISNLWKRITYRPLVGLLQWRSGKESTCNVGDVGSDPWVRKIHWRREWQPTPVFLPGESHGQGSLVGYSPWGCKELNTVEQLSNNNEQLTTWSSWPLAEGSLLWSLPLSAHRKPLSLNGFFSTNQIFPPPPQSLGHSSRL